jgi:hypothetical protein
MAAATQERVDLGLDGLLHDEPDGESSDVLQDRCEVAVGAEQRVNLCMMRVVGETRDGTGVGPPS